MKKYGILEYYLYDILPGEKEETKRVITSSEIEYESEDEIRELIKNMDEEIYNGKHKADKNIVKRCFTEYTIDKRINNEKKLIEKRITELYYKFMPMHNENFQDLNESKGLFKITTQDKNSKKAYTTYVKDGIEISEETYERYSEMRSREIELEKALYLNTRIDAERIIRSRFDKSKLSVQDLDKSVDVLSEALFNKKEVNKTIDQLCEEFKYALLISC